MQQTPRRDARWPTPVGAGVLLVVSCLAPALAFAALLAQTITFGVLAGKTYGAAPFAVSATASSGLPVSFASLTTAVCTVSASTVTIVAAGTCTIRAAQAGDATYAAAPSVNQSFAVAKAAQTITFGALSGKTYGAPPFAVSATASSGLAVSFVSTTTAVCTVTGSTVTIVAGGTCTIQARQAGNGNYLAATSVNQSFAVAKASQTITFGALAGKTYGNPPFTVSATASSGLAVAFSSGTTAVCSVSGNTVTIVTGGTCSIRAAQSGNASYLAATTVTQSFTIAKASQTISFGALANQTYGVAPFIVGATASSGLAVMFGSLTTTVCTVSGSTVTIRAAGTCTVQAAQAGNASYNPAPSVSQSFTVAAGSQTIAFAPLPKQVQGATPALGATASSGLPVTFASLTSAVCTVSAATATLLGVGTCTIEASQGGNAAYAPAPNVRQSFVVMPAAAFSTPVAYATGTFPEGIAAGDFNGDGVVDLAVANAFSASVSVLLGQGDGTFASLGTVQTGGEPLALGAGDFNGDGKPDLAVADFSGNRVVVLRGNGNGTFTQAGALALGQAPSAIAIADLDGDGKLDLVVVNGSAGSVTGQTVTLALGNGDGSFRTGVAYAVGHSPYAVAVADFNLDGKPDLAVANGDDDTVSVLIGRGDGTFAAAVSYAAHYYPDALAVADLNDDGKLDIVVGNDYSDDVSILLGRGDGTFAPATHIQVGSGPASVAAADFNGDGVSDLAVANRFDGLVAILVGNGDGTFQSPSAYAGVGGQLESVVATDLDRDGKPDIVVSSAASNAVAILRNASVSMPPASLAVQSGAAQSAAVGTPYAKSLVVLVEDAGGRPLPGVGVTFTAPSSGASGTFAGSGNAASVPSDAAGIATAPTFTANAVPGSFMVVASAASLTANFALTNTAASGQAPSFTSAAPPNGILSVPYGYAVAASGTPNPTFSVTGLPPGLGLDASTGVISGAPNVVGTFSGTLTASNGVAPSATQSFTMLVTRSPQSIAFPALPARRFGEPPFAIGASASSGLPLGFTTLTPSVCDVTGNTVALRAAGTCTVRATQDGNGFYAAATAVDQSFSVSRADQTIAFSAPGGAALDSGNRDLRASASSGLPVDLVSLTPAVCGVTGTSANFIAVGTCTIRASQAGNANYNAAPSIAVEIAVARAGQTITFWPLAMRPGTGTQFALDATASSGLPVSFASLTPTICGVSGMNASAIAAGTCTIRASQPGDANYAPAAAVERSFTVTDGVIAAPAPRSTGPFIEYSTSVGSSGGDSAFDVVVAADGGVYVGGSAAATDFPGLSSATFSNAGLDLLYVAKLAPDGTPAFATVLGGRAPEIRGTGGLPYVGALQTGAQAYLGGGQVEAMAADGAGSLYVAAYAHATMLPLTGGTYLRNGRASVFKVSPAGSVQTVTSALDPAIMTVRALALDPAGAIYLTGVAGPGLATSANAAIRVMPAPSGAYATQSAPYLVKLAAGGTSLSYATYLSVPGSRVSSPPGSGQSVMDAATTAYALAVDAAGNAYVAGQATADQFPATTGSPDTSDTKNRDAFVAKVNAGGTALAWVARLGGADADRATGIALGPDGSVVIGGKTATQPFTAFADAFQTAVVFAPQTLSIDRETGFVARLSPDGKQWTALAAIGTSGGSLVANWAPDASPYPVKVAVDATGAIYAAGTTWSDRTLPLLVNLSDVGPNGAFVMKMSPDAKTLVYSTTLGDGVATGLALDAFGNAFVAGYDNGSIPAMDARPARPLPGEGNPSAFVVKLNDRVAPIVLTSDQSPAIAGRAVALRATLADGRYGGIVEFLEGGQVIGTASVASGLATLSTTLAVGIHRLRAVFRGDGPFDGYSSPELLVVANQP